MFRASKDGGATFDDKINLSNTTEADSTRVEIDSDADSVVVSSFSKGRQKHTTTLDSWRSLIPLLLL
jgi:hypothetical protein